LRILALEERKMMMEEWAWFTTSGEATFRNK
jgi:hypothetical protein